MSVDGVNVSVLFFASYRDLAGEAERRVEVSRPARVEDLLRRLREDGIAVPEAASVAVNRRYAPADRELADGDEVAIVPPVAGG